MRDLVKALLLSYEKDRDAIKVVLDIDRAGLGMDAAVPCGLIINELVSNSFKHAFPKGRRGEVRVTMRRDGNRIALEVGDDGGGIPQDVDHLHAKSVGLQLVVTLVEQLQGTITLDRERGTKFTIEFAEDRATAAGDASQQAIEHAAA